MRDYHAISSAVQASSDRLVAMQRSVDALWHNLHATGVSWVGFYVKTPGIDEMTLGPRRDKPACSPIGLHGVCGRSWSEQRPQVVCDVRELGDAYVACDPRDQAEVVIPLFDDDGLCWGVLDLDSHDVGSFTAADVEGLQMVLEKSGLRVRI